MVFLVPPGKCMDSTFTGPLVPSFQMISNSSLTNTTIDADILMHHTMKPPLQYVNIGTVYVRLLIMFCVVTKLHMYSIFINMPLTHTTVSAASADLLNSMLLDGRLVRTKNSVKKNILNVHNKLSKFQEPE